MKRRRKQILALAAAGLLAVALAVILWSGPSPGPAVSVRLVEVTNSPAGTAVAVFEIRNQLEFGISRSGYCRINGDVVDLWPTVHLERRGVERVAVPLATTRNLTTLSLSDVKTISFNGNRASTAVEDVISLVDDLLQWADPNWKSLERWDRRRRDWVVTIDFPTLLPTNGATPTEVTHDGAALVSFPALWQTAWTKTSCQFQPSKPS